MYKFLTVDTKPFYNNAKSAVEKHTSSIARLKFLCQALFEGLTLCEVQVWPK